MRAEDEARVRQIIAEEFSNPILWPEGLRQNLRTAVESVAPQIPLSNVVGTYVVADTVAGLGPLVHGRVGVIRGGATPYDYIKVTADVEYGKWVSDWFPAVVG